MGGDAADAMYSQLRSSFQAAIKPLQPGQLSDVIKEERSVHILRLDRRWMDPKTNQMMVHYHEVAFRVEPGADAVREARKSAKALIADARKKGLAKAATAHGFATTQTPFFREGLSNNDVFKRFPEAEAWAFRAKVGSVSNPIPTENGWYIYEIADRQPAGLRPLTQARIFARERLIHSLQVAHAADAAAQARAAMASGANDAEVAKRFHGVPGLATSVTRNGYLGNIGREPKIVGALFGTPPATWSRPITGDWGALIGFVMEHQKPSEEEFQKQSGEIRTQLLTVARQARFTDWLQTVRKRAKIEDYRENYFEA
jgi:peptidyl-prolyl cis-trans isomerase D